MKNFLSLFFAISLTLSACGTATTQPTPPVQTGTPTITMTATQTPTATITPLPTIPTFAPTFDVSSIVTVTPVEKAECPTLDSTINVNYYFPRKLEFPSPSAADKILEYLNSGGNGEALAKRFDEIYLKSEYRGGYAFRDITGDQVSEFLFVEINYEGKPIVFSCQNGNFEKRFVLSGDDEFWDFALEIDDLVGDGIPEIIITGTSGASFPQSEIFIFKWNGQTFEILGTLNILALRKTEIKDTDGNGSIEIIFIGDNPSCSSCSNFLPQRERTITYGWNGKMFAEISNEFSSPIYRFQAVQDADLFTTEEKIDKALNLYNEVIFNKDLEWWSNERFRYEQDASSMSIPGFTPLSEPIEDLTEYPSLAAYAYYRIMLLHLVQEQEAEAASTYQTLKDTLGTDPYAAPYIEMATAFWEAYQSTHKMYDGCAAAIQYAVEHPQILTPLGSDYHGWQSHTYVPADVCPFR